MTVEKSEQEKQLPHSFFFSFPWNPPHTPLTGREETSRPKPNYFPCLAQLPWCMWRKDVGQKTETSKCKVMPLHWRKKILEGQCLQPEPSRAEGGGHRASGVRDQQEASVVFGYLPTFLSSCSGQKSFPKPFGLQQSLGPSLRHEALSGDTVMASAPLTAGWSTIPCLYSCSLMQCSLCLMNYSFCNNQAKFCFLCEV